MTKPVIKSGSLWQGEVISVDGSGTLVTNFKAAEVAPLAESSKLWVQFEKCALTVRGLVATGATVEPGHLFAQAGAGGLIQIAVSQGSASALTHLSVGDRVNLHFRA